MPQAICSLIINPPSQLRCATAFSKEATIADSSVLYFYQVTMRVRSITAANNYGLLLKGAVTEGLRIVE